MCHETFTADASGGSLTTVMINDRKRRVRRQGLRWGRWSRRHALLLTVLWSPWVVLGLLLALPLLFFQPVLGVILLIGIMGVVALIVYGWKHAAHYKPHRVSRSPKSAAAALGPAAGAVPAPPKSQGRNIVVKVTGSPIGGENPPHDRAWRVRIAEHTKGCPPASGVRLDFRLEPHRRVDLDNLVRPALAGLRDAGVFTHGYRNLHTLVATKAPGAPRLKIAFDETGQLRRIVPPSPLITVAASAIPQDGDRASKLRWREQVRRSYSAAPVDRDVWVDIAVRTTASLEGVLKPIIDGLEPFLGRDPSGRLEFVPQDDLVVWLRVTRQVDLPSAIALAAGLYQEL